jgi:hypothetical protein
VGFLGGVGGLGLWGALGGGEWITRRGNVLIGEGEWRERFTQVPGEVRGEHAQKNMRGDSVGEVMPHGPQAQIVGLDRSKVPFDVGEILVRADDTDGVQSFRVEAGSDHIDAVQGGLGGNPVLVPMVGERVIGDGRDEMLADLVLVDDLSYCDADLVGAAQATPR